MRASVAYRMAKGDSTSSSRDHRATRGPPTRSPTFHIRGRQARAKTPESERTATSPDPKRSIQPCSSQ